MDIYHYHPATTSPAAQVTAQPPLLNPRRSTLTAQPPLLDLRCSTQPLTKSCFVFCVPWSGWKGWLSLPEVIEAWLHLYAPVREGCPAPARRRAAPTGATPRVPHPLRQISKIVRGGRRTSELTRQLTRSDLRGAKQHPRRTRRSSPATALAGKAIFRRWSVFALAGKKCFRSCTRSVIFKYFPLLPVSNWYRWF